MGRYPAHEISSNTMGFENVGHRGTAFIHFWILAPDWDFNIVIDKH